LAKSRRGGPVKTAPADRFLKLLDLPPTENFFKLRGTQAPSHIGPSARLS